MLLKSASKLFFFFVFLGLLLCIHENVTAQKIAYSSENVFINNPDNLQLVANIAGNHHLLSFTTKEDPSIFIFDRELTLQKKISIPFKIPERSEIRIIPLNNFYYLYIHPSFSQKYFYGKLMAREILPS